MCAHVYFLSNIIICKNNGYFCRRNTNNVNGLTYDEIKVLVVIANSSSNNNNVNNNYKKLFTKMIQTKRQ